MKRWITYAAATLLLAACDGMTGPSGNGKVAVRFGAGASTRASANLLTTGDRGLAADQLTVTGSNGSIVLDDVRFIVEEMKLRSSSTTSTCGDDENEREDDLRVSADDRSGRDSARSGEDADECEFKGGPFIVDLPLEGNTTVSTENVPPGTYDSFRFKIDDLEQGDDDEADDRVRTPDLLSEMRQAYPDFPSRASMVVKGTQNGQPFTVYFRSKMKIQQAISPPLVVPGDQALTVRIDPSAWFKSGNQVMNLAALNGKLVEFGEQFRSGMSGTHRGDR